jgi:cytochrome c-type biogenesis protein CcmE
VQISRSRRRTARFTFALVLAVVLAGALVYTTFAAGSPEEHPAQLVASAKPGVVYNLGGQVVDGSVQRAGSQLRFKVGDPGSGKGPAVEVVYDGTVPDPFREGRDVLINVKKGADGTYVGQGNSLVTKCPSKFNDVPTNTTAVADGVGT